MFKLNIPPGDYFNEITNEFVSIPGVSLRLEHSLYTISKWESRWLKPFMSNVKKTDSELLDYIICMDISEQLNMSNINQINQHDINRIMQYIEANMTATTFSETKQTTSNREIITSELIYYWIITFNIPIDCEHWHLNRLMTLIKICNIKNSPNKKQDRQTALSKQRAMNKERRQRMESTG